MLRRVFTDKISDLTMNFLMVLAEKGRLNLIREIQAAYNTLEDQQAGRVKGSLITAVELSSKELHRLSEQINRALRKDVELKTKVDPSILGGLILTVEDTLMDASLRSRLDQLSKKLRLGAAELLTAERALITE
jgi:F-type H+-transporting ATPase subunit delta